jgi:hypothetical protein
MKSTRKRKRAVPAENIARLAGKGKSRIFSQTRVK